MKRIESQSVEVDMIPLIDIISLLLMFLIVVGGAVDTEASVQMRLPRADQAVDIRSEGRIVIQLQEHQGSYSAKFFNKSYELVPGMTNAYLKEHLDGYVRWALEKGLARRDSHGNVLSMPVKLRIPEATPMRDAERLLITLSEVGLTDVQYAAAPPLH